MGTDNVKFQGGSYDPFGGDGFDQCYKLVNHEFSRVFDKNNFASGVNIFNIYMVRELRLYVKYNNRC